MLATPHELAFVLGHETAHHIAGHIERQQQNAVAGAVIFAGLATLTGAATPMRFGRRKKLGAQVGARTYSKDFELEADALGTIITAKAGYNPIRGAEFFTRIPDPGDKLPWHPPAQRCADQGRAPNRCGALISRWWWLWRLM